MPAHGMVVQARGGVMSITGETGGPPVRVGASIGDSVAGMFLTQGSLAALYDRDRTVQGALIDVAMRDAQLAIQEHAVTRGGTVAHWIALPESAGLPTARVEDMAEVMRDPQILAHNMVVPVARLADGPAFTAIGNPIKMSNLAEISQRAPAPTLDGDRQAVLDWLAATAAMDA